MKRWPELPGFEKGKTIALYINCEEPDLFIAGTVTDISEGTILLHTVDLDNVYDGWLLCGRDVVYRIGAGGEYLTRFASPAGGTEEDASVSIPGFEDMLIRKGIPVRIGGQNRRTIARGVLLRTDAEKIILQTAAGKTRQIRRERVGLIDVPERAETEG